MKGKLKQIPIGIDNFKELIEKEGYFVDKSLFIKEVMHNISKVILLTRPRRFGKTLNFSMLKSFIEIPECRKLNNEDKDYLYLFDNLKICEEKKIIKDHFAKYPVVNFSFKKIKANDWESAKYFFKEEISREYKRHRYLLDSEKLMDYEKEHYLKIISMAAEFPAYTSAIYELTDYLKKYFSMKAMVLIDEYDTPLHYAKLNGYYDQMLNTIRALMVDGMKSNDNLEKGIVTGIMKISQESIFSSFNNPEIASINNKFCSDQFGFTEAEVMALLKYYDLELYQDKVREWYNGYLFAGEKVIYNPWSILSFIKGDDYQTKAYWVNTGDTSLIKRCLQLDQIKSKDYLERLYQGESLEMEVEENIIYEDVFNNVDKALSYLLHSGYLKAKRIDGEGNKYLLSIPNKEVATIYQNILKNWFTIEYQSNDLINTLIESLLEKNMEIFEVNLQDILLVNCSYYDTAIGKRIKSAKGNEKERYENFYHGLILGLLVNISDEYNIASNKEY
ncbi:AAA family ATPase [Natronospora cellulosivora (SeqCode)]